jgi:thioredoxin-related protein
MIRYLKAAVLILPLTAQSLSADAVPLGDDGLHKPDWLKNSFKVLPEDNAEAVENGRHLMLIVEQRGCIYCKKLHNEVLTDPRLDQMIRERFDVIQIDLFGGTDLTDMDGETLSEKRAAGKWGVTVTPTMLFLPHEPPAGADAARAALAVVPSVLDADHMIALFDWVSAGGPDSGRSLTEVLAD